jgi:hypothetical protein
LSRTSSRSRSTRVLESRTRSFPLHTEHSTLCWSSRYRRSPHEFTHGNREMFDRSRGELESLLLARFVTDPISLSFQHDLEHRLSIFVREETVSRLTSFKIDSRNGIRSDVNEAVEAVCRRAKVMACKFEREKVSLDLSTLSACLSPDSLVSVTRLRVLRRRSTNPSSNSSCKLPLPPCSRSSMRYHFPPSRFDPDETKTKGSPFIDTPPPCVAVNLLYSRTLFLVVPRLVLLSRYQEMKSFCLLPIFGSVVESLASEQATLANALYSKALCGHCLTVPFLRCRHSHRYLYRIASQKWDETPGRLHFIWLWRRCRELVSRIQWSSRQSRSLQKSRAEVRPRGSSAFSHESIAALGLAFLRSV